MHFQDSPLGVRFTDFATVFPAGINTATTWQRDLIRRRGVALGKEFRGKGVHIALGPMMNLGRVAQVSLGGSYLFVDDMSDSVNREGGIGKALVPIRSLLVKRLMRPFSVCKARECRRARSTLSTSTVLYVLMLVYCID